jgi:HTH-type transcriptional regulator, competence development regulator
VRLKLGCLLDTESSFAIVSMVTPEQKSLAAIFRESRDRLGLTLREVEAKTGISNAYLSQLEGGKIKEPSPKTLHKLCELYGCSYSLALELAGYPVPTEQKLPVAARFAARIGKTTQDEEAALLEYLQFLRSRKR